MVPAAMLGHLLYEKVVTEGWQFCFLMLERQGPSLEGMRWKYPPSTPHRAIIFVLEVLNGDPSSVSKTSGKALS